MDSSLERARIAAELSHENLRRLGAACEDARANAVILARERDVALVGVAQWGYTHRQLAEAAHMTPQRVSQILSQQPQPRLTLVRKK